MIRGLVGLLTWSEFPDDTSEAADITGCRGIGEEFARYHKGITEYHLGRGDVESLAGDSMALRKGHSGITNVASECYECSGGERQEKYTL